MEQFEEQLHKDLHQFLLSKKEFDSRFHGMAEPLCVEWLVKNIKIRQVVSQFAFPVHTFQINAHLRRC